MPLSCEVEEHIPYDLMPLLDTHTGETTVHKEMFTAPLFKIVKFWKQPKHHKIRG